MKSGFTETTSEDDDISTERVSRKRRSRFVFIVVAFCLLVSVAIVFHSDDSQVANTAIQGLLSLATFLAMTYVGASSVDYNGGIRNMFSQDTNGRRRSYRRDPVDRRRQRRYDSPDDDEEAVG